MARTEPSGSPDSGGGAEPRTRWALAPAECQPLEILFVREVMRTNIVALPADITPTDLEKHIHGDHASSGQALFPVVDANRELIGAVTRADLHGLLQDAPANSDGQQRQLADVLKDGPIVAYPDEPLRVVAYRMAETGLTRFPVVERGDPRKLVGMLSFGDMLKARTRNLEAERRRERVLPLHLVIPRRWRRIEQGTKDDRIERRARPKQITPSSSTWDRDR
jgi:chloride channel protein, CIC family